MNPESILNTYPRKRPPLSDALSAIYVQTYQASRTGKGLLYSLTQRLESWMHYKVARQTYNGDVLEIGAGTLNQLAYENVVAAYDIIEPFKALYQGSVSLQKVRTIYDDIARVPPSQRYGRIISVATLEHVVDLPQCLAKSGLLLADNGIFQAGIPSEGGFLWGATWRLSVGLSFRLRTGLDYGELMRHEHVNSAQEIIALITYFFEAVRVRWFPLPHRHLSLYAYIEASKPRQERCRLFAQL